MNARPKNVPLGQLETTHAALSAWIGLARQDITPPVGIYARNWGAAMHDTADSIHRPLSITALTIAASKDATPLALIDADLGWWKTLQVFHRVQRRILDATHLEPAQLVFAVTHTHAGPPLMEGDASLPGSNLIKPWIERIIEAAIAAIFTARQGAVEGILEWHHGRCNLASYRDLPDPRATESLSSHRRVVCGFNPQGTPDDTLVVGRVSDRQGRTLATITNYACHPTTLAWDNTAISPDYIGAYREVVEQATGAPALFLQGASGELAPRHQYVGDSRVADRHGRQLGYATLATLFDMEPPGTALFYERTVESGAPLAVWSHKPSEPSREIECTVATAQLPLKDWPSAEQLERERSQCRDRALEERLRRKRDIRRTLGDGRTFSLPFWAWRLGDAALVGCCGEAYSLLQRELRRRFADRTIVCMNLINGSIGYLPPRELYSEDLYQVWQTPFDAGSLEATLEAMSEKLSNWFEASITASPAL